MAVVHPHEYRQTRRILSPAPAHAITEAAKQFMVKNKESYETKHYQIISLSIPLWLPLSGSGAELGTAQTYRVGSGHRRIRGLFGRQWREGYPISSEVYNNSPEDHSGLTQ